MTTVGDPINSIGSDLQVENFQSFIRNTNNLGPGATQTAEVNTQAGAVSFMQGQDTSIPGAPTALIEAWANPSVGSSIQFTLDGETSAFRVNSAGGPDNRPEAFIVDFSVIDRTAQNGDVPVLQDRLTGRIRYETPNVLTSPDGTRWRLTVDNSGGIETVQI